MNDAVCIADLLAHGLFRASFVPPQPIQELRNLTRTRKQLTREIVQHTQRIQSVLEESNVTVNCLRSSRKSWALVGGVSSTGLPLATALSH